MIVTLNGLYILQVISEEREGGLGLMATKESCESRRDIEKYISPRIIIMDTKMLQMWAF